MVVEDALVINETCAGEIVRAAIIASRADAALANQIVQTAISVAPKMTVAITDAASAVTPGGIVPPPQVVVASSSGKNPEKNPLPTVLPPPARDVESSGPVAGGLRGIYLIQPPAGGIPPRKHDNVPTSPCYCTP